MYLQTWHSSTWLMRGLTALRARGLLLQTIGQLWSLSQNT